MTKQISAHDFHPNATHGLTPGVRWTAGTGLAPVWGALDLASVAPIPGRGQAMLSRGSLVSIRVRIGVFLLALGLVALTPIPRVAADNGPGLCLATSHSPNPGQAARSPIAIGTVPGAESAAGGLPGEAYLVKDINASGDSWPTEITAVGGVAFFSAMGPGGRELWKSDGTELGTVRVKNIRAGDKSSNPSYLTAVGGSLFFTATDGSNDRELWVSDGTSAGTRRVKDISLTASSEPYDLANVNGTLFFGAYGPGGSELWKSDGTDVGTVRVKDIRPGSGGSNPSDIIAVGSLAFFSAAKSNETRVWRSDGTAAGTYPLPGQDPYAAPGHFIRVGNRAYFTAINDTGGCSLETSYFRTDGTNEGTFAVADELIEDAPTASFKDRFYYAEGGTLKRANLSESDGVLIKDFGNPVSTDGCNVVGITKVGSKLFVMVDICVYDDVSGYIQTDRQLWKSDGTKAGTKMVLSWGQAVATDPQMTNVGGELMFLAIDADGSDDIFRSDGTAAGTVLVDEPADWSASQLTDVGGSLYFVKDDGITGSELWRIVP